MSVRHRSSRPPANGISNNDDDDAAATKLLDNTSQGDTANSNKKTNNQDVVVERTNPMVYVVFISLLFDLLAFTIILPLLPSLLEYFKNNDSSGLYAVLTERIRWFQELVGAPERYNSVLFGGFLGSMFSFLQFVASPVVGGLSDYYGRKPVIVICAVSHEIVIYIYMHSFFSLFSSDGYCFIVSTVGILEKFCCLRVGPLRWRSEQRKYIIMYVHHHRRIEC